MIEETEDNHYIILSQKINYEATDGCCTIKDIKKVIATFPEEYSTPFSMYIRGFNYDDIAQALKLSVGTVKSRIFYMRQKLQILLKDYR
ncbi:MAG: hypothetical protein E7083_06145 [Bacteroidales bacterium]|nr:hypothetical protein [Bacteroidales bacterium]